MFPVLGRSSFWLWPHSQFCQLCKPVLLLRFFFNMAPFTTCCLPVPSSHPTSLRLCPFIYVIICFTCNYFGKCWVLTEGHMAPGCETLAYMLSFHVTCFWHHLVPMILFLDNCDNVRIQMMLCITPYHLSCSTKFSRTFWVSLWCTGWNPGSSQTIS